MINRAYGFKRNSLGNLISQDFILQVSMGLIEGFSTVDKFGKLDLAPEGATNQDIWEGGGVYVHDTDGTAPIVSLVSSNDNDFGKVCRVHGLDVNGYEVIQDVICNGINRASLPIPLWRVYRLENVSNSGKDFAGNIYVYVGTGGAPTLDLQRAVIKNVNNQTLMCLYTIPRGKVGFLYRGEAGISDSGLPSTSIEYGNFYYRSRRYGKNFQVKKSISCVSFGASNYQDSRSFPDVIPALTDIVMRSYNRSTDLGCWAALDILLVDEDQLTDEFLISIGQPFYN